MKVIAKNKKASFEYFLLENFTAGIVLTGTEIKSIRAGKASINEAYCMLINDEMWIKNMHIAVYEHGTIYNHEPKRDRKLLLQKREIKKIRGKHVEKGIAIIPTVLYIADNGLAKIDIALAKGKKLYDKRETIKTKDINRDNDRNLKY